MSTHFFCAALVTAKDVIPLPYPRLRNVSKFSANALSTPVLLRLTFSDLAELKT